jgi:hypothetical protein
MAIEFLSCEQQFIRMKKRLLVEQRFEWLHALPVQVDQVISMYSRWQYIVTAARTSVNMLASLHVVCKEGAVGQRDGASLS